MNPYQPDYQYGSTYEEECELRKAELVQSLTVAFGGEATELACCPHIFIENGGLLTAKRVRGADVAVRELQLMARAQAVNKLLTAMSTNSPLSMAAMPFLKSPKILDKDKELEGIIMGIKEGMTGTLRVVADRLEDSVSKHQELSSKRAQVLADLANVAAKLDDTDKDGYKTLCKKDVDLSGSWAFWRGWNEEVALSTQSADSRSVIKTAVKSSNYPRGDYRDADLVIDRSNGFVSWKPTVTSPIWCGVGYTFKLEMSFRDYYEKDIIEAKEARKDHQSEKTRLDAEMGKSSHAKSKDEQMIIQLNKRVSVLDELVTDIRQPKKSVEEWMKPDGYAEFYRWLTKEDALLKKPTVVLVKYGSVMGLRDDDLDALVADFTSGSGAPPQQQWSFLLWPQQVQRLLLLPMPSVMRQKASQKMLTLS